MAHAEETYENLASIEAKHPPNSRFGCFSIFYHTQPSARIYPPYYTYAWKKIWVWANTEKSRLPEKQVQARRLLGLTCL
jgi:hypothetical protein